MKTRPYKPRKPEPEQHEAGTCRVCGRPHYFKCAVDGCGKTGTITDSTAHSCAGSARWVCGTHFRGTA
jgi:hypothetical protein